MVKSYQFWTQEEAEGNTGKAESDGGMQIIANAGGRVYRIARNNQLHLYGIYSHTHQNGMTAHLSTGETYNFSAVDSGRLRIGARLSWQKKKTQSFYSGIAYQYEYATGVSGTYRGRSTDSSGIHGSSAMLELGWQVKPSERSSWMVDVGAVGWVGH